MTTREQLEQEAEGRYPIPEYIIGTSAQRLPVEQRRAFIAGRTVTAEQVERGSKASYAATGSPLCWEVAGKPAKQEHRKRVRAAFRAAGFYVEGEDDG